MAMRRLKDIVSIQNPVHWDPEEVNVVLKAIPGNMWELLLELLSGPKSFQELVRSNTRVVARFEYFSEYKPEKAHRMYLKKLHLNEKLQQDLALLISFEILERNGDIYRLTLKGREIAEHGKQLAPKFIGKILSAKLVSGITLILHVILTIVKLSLGFLFGSAGLIADGVDNGVDTGSSLLIWLGVKYKKERLISLIIIILMYASLGLIGYEAIQKFLNPEPIDKWGLNLIITLICGGLMWILSGYQYLTGQYQKNFPIVCQSVDSQNHFYTSLLVSVGIIFSVIAQETGLWWFNYVDAIASVIVGILILKGAIELTIEFRKAQEEEILGISHYIKRSMERLKQRIILGWLHRELEQKPLDKDHLIKGFLKEFGKKPTAIESFFPLGFQPETLEEFEYYLNYFQKKQKITELKGKYYLSSIIGTKIKGKELSIKPTLVKLHFQQIVPKIMTVISTILIFTMIGWFIYDAITGLDYWTAIYCGSMFVLEIILSNISRFLRRREYYTKRNMIFLLVIKGKIRSVDEIRQKSWIKEREIKEILQVFINNKIVNEKLDKGMLVSRS